MPEAILERIALRRAVANGWPPDQVRLVEEELGWVVWAPGFPASYSTFIDKATGRVVGYANPNFPDQQYRRQLEHEAGLVPRPGFGGPVLRPPATVAEVSLAGVRGRAASVRDGAAPSLHPLVAARLDAIGPRARVRGAERHAELAAYSAALDAGGDPGAEPWLTLRRIGEPGDPRIDDATAHGCHTCRTVLGVRPGESPVPQPLRLAGERLRVLSARAGQDVDAVVARVAAVTGRHARHEPSPAAVDELRRHLGARSRLEVPGRAVRTSVFRIDPLGAAESADTLARVGDGLFPVGTAGLEGLLAIDPRRHVVLVDESGAYALGTGLRAAMTTLMFGRRVARLTER